MNYTKSMVAGIVALGVTLLVVLLGWSKSSTDSSRDEFVTEVLQTQPAHNAMMYDLGKIPPNQGLQVQFVSNGRDRLVARIRNESSKPVSIRIRPGLIFDRLDQRLGSVALIEGGYLNLKPRSAEPFYLKSVALASNNTIESAPYRLTSRRNDQLQPVFRQISRLPVYSKGAVQTAVLALRENLPLSAFASFPLMSGDRPSTVNTEAFRVSVADIISALNLLKNSGFEMESLAITVDPQLVVEAMVDPMARMPAMNYYGIQQNHEWLFWREMLNNGPQALRHYALHGIARFYPEIALDMHPRWIRSENVNPVMRAAAISGLAETGHPDALPIFAQLEYEFRQDDSVLKQLNEAESYLERAMEARLRAMNDQLVAFRYEPLQPRQLDVEQDASFFPR